jgi:signal transduction histidine kinase
MQADEQAQTSETGEPPLPWWPWLMALLLWLALALLTSLQLWHLRRHAVENQGRELRLLSLALTDEIDRGLRGVEEGLRALRTELHDGRLVAGDPGSATALRTRADLMPLVSRLWLLDAAGRVIAASDAAALPDPASFAPPLATLGVDTVAFSRPYSDAGSGLAMVALALRDGSDTTSPGASPARWILAAMPASALLGAFAAALPAADARMVVVRNDGVRLAAANAAAPARDEAVLAQRLSAQPELALRRFQDGSDHLVGLHGVPRYGIRVLVARDLSVALLSWRQAAQLAAAALALLLLMMAAAVHAVQRAERRRRQAQQALQTQRARASRLESLGTLAGGVAHDFNNVLAGIVGFGEMAHTAAPAGSDQARHLDKVLQAASRGQALVERVLAFSRGGARSAVVFELEPVVEEVLTLLTASLRPGVVLERALEASQARLRGDPTQAFEAVMNLCTNALQAMQDTPSGGLLSVRLRREAVAVPRVLSHSRLAVGPHLALCVSDQGHGIAPAVMERLFEPFFTTRAAQSGTGLGLAVVHGVVAEFKGAIDVQSTPGQGARFTIYLPECTDILNEGAPPARRP